MSLRLTAAMAGLVLATLPFLIYGSRGHVHAPHTDHAPRHGGELFMLGDYHVEVVTLADTVEIYLSDASRRPLRPANGRVALESGREVALRWQQQRLVAALPSASTAAQFEITTADGAQLLLPGSVARASEPSGLGL